MTENPITAALRPAVTLVLVLAAIFVLQNTVSFNWGDLGVLPRNIGSLYGILTFPFIHADWKHLFNNSTALLVLLTLLFHSYREIAWKSLLWVYLMSGAWLWVIGRPDRHIGASAVVYGLFGFLFLGGVLRRDGRLMAVSLLVIFLYGSLVWGIFPTTQNISWEGHLTGLLSGLALAVLFRDQGPQRKVYSWEMEEDIDEETGAQGEEQEGDGPMRNE
jgi:membrane associated rhomboid family serine protease